MGNMLREPSMIRRSDFLVVCTYSINHVLSTNLMLVKRVMLRHPALPTQYHYEDYHDLLEREAVVGSLF